MRQQINNILLIFFFYLFLGTSAFSAKGVIIPVSVTSVVIIVILIAGAIAIIYVLKVRKGRRSKDSGRNTDKENGNVSTKDKSSEKGRMIPATKPKNSDDLFFSARSNPYEETKFTVKG